MKTVFKISTLLILFLTISISSSFAKDNQKQILDAMRDEISRSLSELKLESLQRPYYIEYLLKVSESHNLRSVLGSTTEKKSNKSARLTVQVRVGDYKFDNSNFFDINLSFFGSSDDEERYKNRSIQYEIDYNSLRKQLWLATDAAYKQAAEILSKKEAVLKNRMRKDTTHDFTQEKSEKNYVTTEHPSFDIHKYEKMCNMASKIFAKTPDIHVSAVNFEYQPTRTYFVNSEGMEYVTDKFLTGVEMIASTQAKDGMPVANFFSAYSTIPNKLPSQDSIINAATAMRDRLSQMIKSTALEETYSGPVLFTSQASAELFAQVFAPNLVAQRKAMTEGGVQTNDRFGAFQRKIGGRVLPEFLSLHAKPNLESYKKTPLMGYYSIDEDGVKPQDVLLVKDGYLKNLLSSRIPIKRVRKSNGHKRGGSPMISNIELDTKSANAFSYAELKSKMMKLCKDRELPFGIVIKKVLNQNIMFTGLYRTAKGNFKIPRGQNIVPLIEVYKVFPDGREELIRGSIAGGFTVQSFKDILATSKDKQAHNMLMPSVVSSFVSGGDQFTTVSYIVPDILFEDGEIRTIDDDFKKTPFMANPLADK